MNGDKTIDGRDASDVLSFYAKSSAGNGKNNINTKAADVNSDSIVDGRDASMILTYYSKVSVGYKKASLNLLKK